MALPTTSKGWGAVVLTITTTAQAIPTGSRRRVMVLRNTHASVTCYLGGPDLTSANTATDGYPLAPGELMVLATEEGSDTLSLSLYAVTAAASATLAVLGSGI